MTKSCGCGCGILLDEREDMFIKCDSNGKWYVDQFCMYKDFDIEEKEVYRDGVSTLYFRIRCTDYWYTEKELYKDLQAYYVNRYD